MPSLGVRSLSEGPQKVVIIFCIYDTYSCKLLRTDHLPPYIARPEAPKDCKNGPKTAELVALSKLLGSDFETLISSYARNSLRFPTYATGSAGADSEAVSRE